jgi:hypothetical protein
LTQCQFFPPAACHARRPCYYLVTMKHRNNAAALAIVTMAAALTSQPVSAQTEPASSNGITSLTVQQHPKSVAIDVSGRGTPGQVLTVTLVQTIDLDIPDVVLSRTSITVDRNGAFAAPVSIAPGFTRGSIITVYVTSRNSSTAATAKYLPDSPNRGVVIPLDEVPRAVR